ncbi:hypothetical protein [Acanthopleuribacter pedis]|uniref:Uncharacterized protein n=1 Tax=Acanthopleuribacter pedis TaxID=442870 RepID=A0A8J7QEJ2_9BACT|nr:hypothetical protein [Acanthopleuribacter pedis]MBO1319376.1 hypothetical protein [Acanthopleuribacter pedis]
MDNILTITNRDLDELSSDQAVDFVRELLWAEASAVGIAKNWINVPSSITVADGGIDAEVEHAEIQSGQGVIKKGITRYQIKTGNFNLSQKSYIQDIFFKKNKTELKPRVQTCFEKNGTFIIILFGWDDPQTTDDFLDQKIREYLPPVYQEAKIEVWRQNTLIGFFQHFPALALRLNRNELGPFQAHEEWSNNDDMLPAFQAGEDQQKIITGLQAELTKENVSELLQIWGEAGIGKTRIILEATKRDDIRPYVIYCQASQFRSSRLMPQLLRRQEVRAILVLDECNADDRSYIWNKFKRFSDRIFVICIYNQYEDATGIRYFDIPGLPEEKIKIILIGHKIPEDVAMQWVRECNGSPRVAHVIGQNLLSNPDDLLKEPANVRIWDRYIAGNDSMDSQMVRERAFILRHLALFKRFGFEFPYDNEAKSIARLIEKADRSISPARFREVVKDLRNRKILQGTTTLYITPKLLHVKLWIDYWETYDISEPDILPTLPDQLKEWFLEMFEYAAGSPVATARIKTLLGDQGPFVKMPSIYNDKAFARFFFHLAETCPLEATRCLQKTIGTWDYQTLKEFHFGRREIVETLESLARRRDTFPEASRLLLRLAEAENEPYSNNASGTFVDLFALDLYGELGSTEAAPPARFLVLKEAFESGNSVRRALALQGFNQALMYHSQKVIVHRSPLLKPRLILWKPKTYGELFDAYRQAWEYLIEALSSSKDAPHREILEILLRHCGSLCQYPDLSSMILDSLEKLAADPPNRLPMIPVISDMLSYDKERLPDEAVPRLQAIREALEGSDYSSLLKRYVGTNYLSDNFDDQGDYHQVHPKIQELAEKAALTPELLNPELEWLVTAEAIKGHSFGYEVGKKDTDLQHFSAILEAHLTKPPNESAVFLGGYLKAVAERDQNKWEEIMVGIADEKHLRKWVPEVTARSEVSNDPSADRVLRVIRDHLSTHYFQIFIYGGYLRKLSLNAFGSWQIFLLNSNQKFDADIALYFMFFRLRGTDSKGANTQQLLMHTVLNPALFSSEECDSQGSESSHKWFGLATKLLEISPESIEDILPFIFQHLGEGLFARTTSPALSILTKILKARPEETWKHIEECLSLQRDRRFFVLAHWLKGSHNWSQKEDGALLYVPAENIWKWVEEDVDNRAWRLATFVPPILPTDGSQFNWVRETLIRYGERDDVQRNLHANVSSGSWVGSASDYYQNKKNHFAELLKDQQNPNVRRFYSDFLSSLNDEIKRAKDEEERLW